MDNLPCMNHLLELSRFVDACIIHDDNGVATREWVHVVEKPINKIIEHCSSVRVILNIEMEDAIK